MGVPLLVALLGEAAAGPVIGAIVVDLVFTSTICLAIAQSQTHRAGVEDRTLLQAGMLSLRGALTNPLPWSIALGALFAASVAWKALAVHEVDPSSLQAAPWVMPLPNFLDQFAVGMGLAVLSVRYADGLPRALALVERRPWLAWLASAIAFWAVATRIGLEGRLGERFDGAQFIARHELYTVVALGIVLPAIFGWTRRDPVRRLLALRPLLYVGLVSYAVYLWHYALILKLARGINDTLTGDLGLGLELRVLVYFVLGAAAAVAVATVSYQLVERPALRLKRLVAPPAEEQRGEATAEPAPAAPTAS
jgi:peptidoglycan/LPS O-acetylase OafA/YrhL